MFINSVQVKSYLEFVHGEFQCLEYNRIEKNNTACVLVLRTQGDE